MQVMKSLARLKTKVISLFRFSPKATITRDTRAQITQLAQAEVFDELKPGESHLAADAEFSGLILSRSERFRISGQCTGELRQLRRGASIDIASTAKVNGKIVSTVVDIKGKVIGEVDSKNVTVSKGGAVQGVIEYETLEVRGQLLNAELKPKEFWSKEKPKGVTHI